MTVVVCSDVVLFLCFVLVLLEKELHWLQFFGAPVYELSVMMSLFLWIT